MIDESPRLPTDLIQEAREARRAAREAVEQTDLLARRLAALRHETSGARRDARQAPCGAETSTAPAGACEPLDRTLILVMAAADLARTWCEAIAAMRSTGDPCPGISADKWPAMRERALDFLTRDGTRAVELGWTAEDLFGVHPRLGTQRVDYAGALVLDAGRPVDGFDADRMWTGHLTYYRDRPGRPVGVPIWSFREDASIR